MSEKVSGAEFLRKTSDLSTERKARSATEEGNIKRARDVLGFIQTLKASPAFQWYERECISESFKQARGKLLGNTKPEDLPAVQKMFHGMMGVRIWLLEQEIVSRQELNRMDPEIPILERAVFDLKN